MTQKVMAIHLTNGSTVCTPNGFAMKARIKRLKAELKVNQARGFKSW